MTEIAIRVDELGKRYRIGAAPEKYRTLRDTVAKTLAMPARIARSLWSGPDADGGRGYETIWALRDVSFDVECGDVIGVIGRNGAGKSTLLKVLSRITHPTVGAADIYGRVGSLLEVGTGFHPELSGRENIYLNGAILGMRRDEIRRKFEAIVEFAEVAKFIDTPVKHYSSGMYLRLAFAVAAHLDPEILLVDEVLAVGDAAFQAKCLGQMHHIAGEGRTIVFVSHNMAAISRICNKAVVLNDGYVDYHGDVDTAIARYLNQGNQVASTLNFSDVERRGTGDVQIKTMRITTGGRECASYRCGDPLELSLYYESLRPIGREGLSIQLRFLNSYGDTLLTLWNKLVERDAVDYPQSGWLTFSLEQLPLRPGSYPLTFWAKTGRQMQDLVERATSLEVVEGDVLGTGRIPPPDCGPIMFPYRCSVREEVLSETEATERLSEACCVGNGSCATKGS